MGRVYYPRTLDDWEIVFADGPRNFTRNEKLSARYLRSSPVGLIHREAAEVVFGSIQDARVWFDFDPLGRTATLFADAVKTNDFETAKKIFNNLKKELSSDG